jgi:lipoprotein-releasing system ATP-binding protein
MRIEIRNLTKRYQDADRTLTVIEGVSFSFPESGSVAILGRSGIGKSTLLHLLGGLDVPSEGTVRYGDTVVSALSPDDRAAFRARRVGFIFQFHHLLPEFSALENVAMPLVIAAEEPRIAEQRAAALLERVGLRDRMHHLPSQLSGGEQQRVAIARALVTEPEVVLADEPTGNLDVNTAAQVQDLLIEMNRQQKNTLIVVTHSYDLARTLGMAVEMLPGGRLVSCDLARTAERGGER